MCGLVGMTGISKDPELSFRILTALMRKTQKRGYHATGFYYVDINNQIGYYKLGLSSRVFTRLEPWKELQDIPIKGFIGHTRFSTTGSSKNNVNNHPFISPSENIGLVHNGTLNLYHKHKGDYTLKTGCDSELLLRIIIKENNIIKGINKIYELFGKTGDFACEVLYRNPDTNTSNFYFFRDTSRPGRFIDLTEQLGQFFFTSTAEIWNETITELGLKNIETVPVVKIPSFEIWLVETETNSITKYILGNQRRTIKKKIEKEKIEHRLREFQTFLPQVKKSDVWFDPNKLCVSIPKIEIEENHDELVLYHSTYAKDPTKGKVIFE